MEKKTQKSKKKNKIKNASIGKTQETEIYIIPENDWHNTTSHTTLTLACLTSATKPKEFPAQDGADLHVRVLPGAGVPAHHHRLLPQRLQGAITARSPVCPFNHLQPTIHPSSRTSIHPFSLRFIHSAYHPSTHPSNLHSSIQPSSLPVIHPTISSLPIIHLAYHSSIHPFSLPFIHHSLSFIHPSIWPTIHLPIHLANQSSIQPTIIHPSL